MEYYILKAGNDFEEGNDYFRFFESFETRGVCYYLGKMIVTRLLRANRNNVNTLAPYRIITASSIKPFHRVNGHQPWDIDV